MNDWRTTIDVTNWKVVEVETSGSHAPRWLTKPDSTGGENDLWLHKSTFTPENGIEQGEDWAEVISTQVGIALGVPCARTHLCLRHGARGSISQSIRAPEYDLWEGWVALEDAQSPGYFRHEEGIPGKDPSRPGVRRPGHNIENIREALNDHLPPADFVGPDYFRAFDVFVGYLLLDALIANRDRHESNWAVLSPKLQGTKPRLAPSYDHASSLGFNLTNEYRRSLLSDPRLLTRWVEKGTAYRFEHVGRPISLVDHAVAALNSCPTRVRQWWADRVRSADLSNVLHALEDEALEPMSHPATSVASAILIKNLGRLNDALATNN